MSKKVGKIIVGILIAACGVCIGGQALGLFPGYSLTMAGWWTVFLLLPGVLILAAAGLNMFSALITGFGILFLLDEQGILADGLGYRLAIPYALVVVGLAVIFHKCGPREFRSYSGGIFAGSRGDSYFAIFGGSTPQLSGGFRNARGVAVFGSVNFDLRGTEIRSESVLHVCAIFGTAHVVLPPDVRLLTNSVHIFGGIMNDFVPAKDDPNAPVILVRAVSIFGGTCIR